MSDLLAAAAAALGTPEAIVQRSAQARADATGSTVDEVLAAWAGGAPVASAAPPPQTAAPVETTPPPAAEAAPAAAIVEIPAAPPPVTVTQVPAGKPPTLVGAVDNPMTVVIGAVGLFLAVFLVGLLGPSVQTENPGARTSDLAHSNAGEIGQDLYESEGCAACHTQLIRPIVADVGLGPVTLNDSNQVLGTRRFGPDLSDVGSRLGADEIESIVTGSGGHPPSGLSSDDLANLVTYLVESNPSETG